MTTTKTNLTEAVVIERTFNAAVARVWEALTNADEMRVWYFDLKEFKPEVGFEFEFVVEHEGNRYHHLCRVTDVVLQKKIAYTWRYKGEPGNSLVTIELLSEGDKTRLTYTEQGVHFDGLDSVEGREEGTRGLLEQLASHLASGR